MKLVIATPLYPPEPGGPATHTFFLEQTLPGRGIETVTVPFSRVRRLPKVFRHIRYGLLVYREARRADAVFAQDTVSAGIPAYFAARLAGKPFLVRVPGDHAWEQARQRFGVTDDLDTFQTRRYGWQVEFLRRVRTFTVRHADKVIVPSGYFERLVGGWLGDDTSTLKRIYNGIDLAINPSVPNTVPQHPFLVSVGRLVPWKGFRMLIELLPELPEWSLVIIGGGPGLDVLKDVAQTCAVSDKVVFTGDIARNQVLGWLSVADVFVLNSSFESFSYQTAEALSIGVPTIATTIGSIPELITDGVEGVLCAPDDREAFLSAIRSVRTDTALWERRRTASKEKAKQFSVEYTADAFAQTIRDICDG